MENNSINEIVETALSNLQKVAEVNTIVGKPLVTVDGTTIVPVSQITFAFMAGGGEYGNGHFAGGSGAGVTVTPIAMMLITERGVKLLPIDTVNATINNVTEAVPETIDRIGEIIATLKGNQSHS